MRDPLFRSALILGLLSAVGPFAIDMYLPALPQVARDLGTDEAGAALTLTAYFLVFGIAQMIYGPMADAVGRKKPLLIGVSIFLVASVMATFATDITMLIAARALQALGAATLMVVPRAIIRDMASGADAARMMSAIMIVISVSPMLAPLTGSMVMSFGGWREIFAILGAASVLSLLLITFALPETLPAPERRPVRARAIWAGMRRLLTDRTFVGLTMIGGFGMASFFVFLASGSFVYTREFGLSPTGFSIAFAVNAIGFFGASQLAGRFAARLGLSRVITLAISGFTLATVLLAAIGWVGLASLPVVVIGLFVANAFLGLVLPTTMAMAMDPHPDIAGLAASLGGTVQMLTGGIMIAVTSLFLENSAANMLGVIALCGVLAWLASAAALAGRRAMA